jgi:protein translocase SecG subunit
MSWIIGILTFFLVLVCIFLSLLVLAQKPKKDTGGGLAFGGGATDALFGAGSGDMFTKLTKYATTVFFVIVLLLSILNAQQSRRRSGDPRLRLSPAERQADLAAATAGAAASGSTAAQTNGGTKVPAATTPAPTGALLITSATNLLTGATNPVPVTTATPTNPTAPTPAPKPAAAPPQAEAPVK